MAARMEMLKTTEAAVVSCVALRDVNRVIDEGILPKDLYSLEEGRHVWSAACMLIAFYFASARRLTVEERLHAINATASRLLHWHAVDLSPPPDENWTVQDEFLTIDLAPFMRTTAERLDRLAQARGMVESSPDILSGTPVVRGTRIPVQDIAASLAVGHSKERILAAYPSLDAKAIDLAALYAEANPARGRPRGDAGLPKGAVIVSDRGAPRRGMAG